MRSREQAILKDAAHCLDMLGFCSSRPRVCNYHILSDHRTLLSRWPKGVHGLWDWNTLEGSLHLGGCVLLQIPGHHGSWTSTGV